MNIDFFISHSSEIKSSIAIPIAQFLSAMGFNIWIDKKEISSGEHIYQSIESAITNSLYCIAIIDENFLEKAWTKEELQLFHYKETEKNVTYILPVYVALEKTIVCKTFEWLDGRAFEKLDSSFFDKYINFEIICRILNRYYKDTISKTLDDSFIILEDYTFPCKDTLLALFKTKTYPLSDFRIAIIELCNIEGVAYAIYKAIMPSPNKIIDTSHEFYNILRERSFDANYLITYPMYVTAINSVTATIEQLVISLDFI